MKRVPCLQFNPDKLGQGRRVAVPCGQFFLFSLSSYPRLLLALKRLGWKWSTYQSFLSPSWGMVGQGPGFFFSLSLWFLSLLLFSYHVLGITLCTLYFLRPALWFNMHDKFYSCVHIPIICWTEHPISTLCLADTETLLCVCPVGKSDGPSFASRL